MNSIEMVQAFIKNTTVSQADGDAIISQLKSIYESDNKDIEKTIMEKEVLDNLMVFFVKKISVMEKLVMEYGFGQNGAVSKTASRDKIELYDADRRQLQLNIKAASKQLVCRFYGPKIINLNNQKGG